MISVHFQGKSFSITVIQVYSLTNNAEAEVEWFCEDLQDFLELTNTQALEVLNSNDLNPALNPTAFHMLPVCQELQRA